MRLFLLTALTLIAFAANSVLARAALAEGAIGPGLFTALRLAAGALMLGFLVAARRRRAGRGAGGLSGGWFPALMLLVYAAGFSFAYTGLPTGTGALILFGGVQVTMFAGALAGGERPGVARWAGAVLALAGLGVLFAPGAAAPAPDRAALMLAAAVGWGVYSLRGRAAGDALGATAGNFLLAAVPGCAIGLLAGEPAPGLVGVLLAVASGAVASGLGYALWYTVLLRLEMSVAAVAQLTVPLIALAGGMVFLGEPATWRFAVAAALVLGGVGGAILLGRRRA
ncbi:DMT family transporter [Paroceanicella profunda]|uniref:DMT family transporter n=1 Tax=Paroceanicella profunda TaxID=2579971 RepID=A0A5B8FHR9_9RHOB|nr:DMT family transporter [Paroceanicella profunda]QDL92288.1 DMT family transporter [Paroceanicella profunda]